MFKDAYSAEPATPFWQMPDRNATAAQVADAPTFGEDESGAVWHLYREIARRIPSRSYTRHPSTLGDAAH
jgi:hypothetical protein